MPLDLSRANNRRRAASPASGGASVVTRSPNVQVVASNPAQTKSFLSRTENHRGQHAVTRLRQRVWQPDATAACTHQARNLHTDSSCQYERRTWRLLACPRPQQRVPGRSTAGNPSDDSLPATARRTPTSAATFTAATRTSSPSGRPVSDTWVIREMLDKHTLFAHFCGTRSRRLSRRRFITRRRWRAAGAPRTG